MSTAEAGVLPTSNLSQHTSWSSAQERDDRTTAASGFTAQDSRGGSHRARCLVAAFALGLVLSLALLALAAPALADDPPGSVAAPAASTAASSTDAASGNQPNQGNQSNQGNQGNGPAADSGSTASSTDSSDAAGSDPSGPGNSDAAHANGNQSGDGPGNSAAAPANGNQSGDGPGNSDAAHSGAASHASQNGASNGNTSVRTGVGGDNGQVSQTNSASAGADSSSTGSTAAGADGSGSDATAGAQQDSPGNSNVNVRVGSPGDNGAVTQSNDAQADATASGVAGDSTDPSGNATAAADQSSPSNLNVSVRVGSAGDNGPVTQQNTVAATANAPGSSDGGDGQNVPADPATADQSVDTTSLGGVVNSGTVDQSIDQDQDGGGSAAGPASGTAGQQPQAPSTSTGSASATQSNASNVNVSIRVGSPGSDGDVTQANTATATGSTPDSGAVTVTGGADVNVSVDLPGPVSLPTSGDPWTWNWTWTGGSDPNAPAPTAPTDGNSWSWSWTGTQSADPAAQQAQQTSTSDSNTSQPGVWTWTWTWTLADGDTWSLNLQTPCDCSWTWTWSWDWSAGTPASAPSATSSGSQQQGQQPASTADVGAVTQSNVAASDATALTNVQVTQTAPTGQADPSAASQYADSTQTFLAAQSASATATVAQLQPSNLSFVWGVATRGVTQANVVQAIAWASAELQVDQTVEQQQDGGASAQQSASASQLVAAVQSATAVAQAGQSWGRNANVVTAPKRNSARIGTVWQTNSGLAAADAEITAVVTQWIGQYQTAGVASVQQAVATQELGSEQTAIATASTSQTHVENRNLVVVPAGSRATNPPITQLNHAEAQAGSYDDLVASQSIRQAQGGTSDIELSTATQLQATTQTAQASSSAEQADLLDKSGWRGVEPPAGSFTGAVPPLAATSSFRIDGARTASTGWVFRDGWKPRVVTVHGTALRLASPQAGSLGTLAVGAAPPLVVSAGTTAIPRLHNPVQAHGSQAPDHSSNAAAPFAGAPGSGAAGSAPSPGGGGVVGVLSRPFKLAAPAHLGPQSPAPGLGRPVAFLDPFERPG